MKKIVVLIMLSIFSFGSIHAEIAWNLSSDGTLTIFATLHMLAEGMPDYSYPDYAPWYSHRDKIKKVVIKNGVASIGNYAFYGCSSLTSLTIPNSVKSIGDFAFDNCSSLTSLTIGMRKIGNSFSGFSSLKTITFIDGVESIGERAFYRCSALSSVTFPNSLTSIGFEAFYDCFCLTKIFNNSSLSLSPSNELSANGWISYYASVIYNNVNVIIDNDFRIYQDSQGNSFVCDYIGTDKIITLPKNVYGIADYTFSGCSGLTSITIPNSVTSIGKKAFSGCSGLTSITIPNSVTSIESGAFMNCSGLTSITIPNSVTSIGSSAFRNCSNLTSISIPNSVTSIGGYAFSGTKWYDNQPDGVVYVGKILYKYKGTMPSNTKINIKEGTTVIAGEAFRGCEGLYSISIPNSVTVIENDAFFRCTNLKKATIEVNKYLNIKSAIFCENDLKELIMIGETLPQYTADDFAYGLYKITLYVPSSLYKKYRSTSPWSRFTNIVGIPDESINLTDMEAFAVIAKISIIGTVEYTDACKHRINNANNAYNALTDAQKELVSNIDVLTTAQQTYKNLKAAEKLAADKAKADPVIAKINAIGMVEYTDACKKRINDANDAYFFLTTDQQALVTNLDVLTTAKQTYANLKAAADKLAADKARAKIVINKIKAIGMVEYTDACKGRIDDASTAYEALTDDQKALVTNLGILTIAKQTYTALKIAAAEKLATDKAEADLVIAKINAICKVEYTNACKDKIDEANNAYNALTADQKALVTNLDVLKTAKQTYDNLKAAAEKLAADKVKADAVIAKIVAIGNVEYTDACKDKIDDANTAYEALTTDQKALVTNLDVLTTAKQTYDSLKAAAEKLAADKAAFDKYKSEIIAIIEALVKDDDSDAVKEIIRKAISDIESLEYEEAISIDDNKAKVKSFVTLTDEAVENQRAEDQKTNGIEELEFAEKYNIYDLNGRKITNSILKSGLYIRNGKKMVVK